MIIVCNNCSATLQIADEKIPKHSFSLRCPKCQGIINNAMPAENNLSFSAAPAPPPRGENPSFSHTPAPPFMTTNASLTPPVKSEPPDALRQLLELLQGRAGEDGGLAKQTRRALLCVASPRRPTCAKLLSEQGYQVYLAENCRQAVDRLKAEQMHIVLLDTEFSLEENGFRFMSQEMHRARPAQRRRMLVVKIAPDARTEDYHAAFLQSVNLLVNTNDLNLLPDILERALRQHNELYREFYHALETTAI
jgi:predicted Zn finger-like uncharacterized protein